MTQSSYIPLGGGVDLVKPPRQLEPGKAFYAVNYECPVTGGYRRIEGYTQIGPAVPGTGPILGVVTFADKHYAIRGNGDGTASLYVYNDATDSWDVVANGTLNEARHEFIEGNVFATNTGRALYFVGGGKPFELKVDGTLTELTNAPSGAKFIALHKNHLFLGFEAGSLQFSGPGTPNAWDAATEGAGEIGVGDKTGVYYSPTGITTVEFLDQPVVADTTEFDSGEEAMLIGDDAGKVHRLDDGAQSFNGTAIRAFIALAYTDLNAANVRKRYRRAFFDIGSGTDTTISVKPGFDFGDIQSASHGRFFLDYQLDGGLWSVDDWNEFAWSAPIMANEPVNVAGSGTSINFAIYSESVSRPHVFYGYTLNYESRRLRRG